MTREEVKEWVEKETGRVIQFDVPLTECGLDSLDFMELMIKAEEQHGVVIEDQDIRKCVTINDMHELFERKNGSKAS